MSEPRVSVSEGAGVWEGWLRCKKAAVTFGDIPSVSASLYVLSSKTMRARVRAGPSTRTSRRICSFLMSVLAGFSDRTLT